jgi:hypothetical protein
VTILTDEEVAERAQRWARLHKNEKYRNKMDDVLVGLSAADQRRVYLCGQRMAGGLPLKVIPASPAATKATNNTKHITPAVAQADAQSDASERMVARKEQDEKTNKGPQRRKTAAKGSPSNPQKGKTMGAGGEAAESGKRRSRSRRAE